MTHPPTAVNQAPDQPCTPADRAPLTVWQHGRLVTLADARGWGLIDDGALITGGAQILWVGAMADLAQGLAQVQALNAGQAAAQNVEQSASDADADIRYVDLAGAVVTPGLIDAHTHLVYGGQRAREFELRLQGASYEEIALAGGGIRSTVRATREASQASLLHSARLRAQALMAEGVTTVEIKSGYGLSYEHEARCLRVARQLGRDLALTVRTTCLSAHALPPEFDGAHGGADAYIDAVCAWLPQLHAEGLVDAVDAFCERIAFSPAQTQRVFDAARALGLTVKLHAEQLSDQGGAALAARYGALSCDHLEYLSADGVAAMAQAGTVAMLLPGAYYFLRETQLPPIQALRDAGVPMALATDHNPGSSPALSPLLMLNMGCTLFRLTPEEALRGMTVHAAKALGLPDRGQLKAGLRADFIAWSAEQIRHPNELAYWFGQRPALRRVVAGVADEQGDPLA